MKLVGLNKLLVPAAAVFALSLITACGNTKYAKQTHGGSASANNLTVTTKPKVDIVLFQDNSDSVMFGPIGQIKPEMQNFLLSLSNEWDYHFVVLPLLSTQSISSKYVVASDCSSITAGVTKCYSSSEIGNFNYEYGDAGWINSRNSATGSLDQGFNSMKANLNQSGMIGSSRFLRPDAAMAVIVMSNGEDLSGVNPNNRGRCFSGGDYRPDLFRHLDYCIRQADDGQYEINPYANSLSSSYSSFRADFVGLKGSAQLSKLYSIVSYGNSCLGSGAFVGNRYIAMSQSLASTTADLCSGGFNRVLSDIRSNLKTVVQAIKFNYVVISADRQPVVSSIKVWKNGVEVPQSSSNGWSYVGYTTQATSYFPTSGNIRTGYMIKLNGSYEFQGSDVITFDFDPL